MRADLSPSADSVDSLSDFVIGSEIVDKLPLAQQLDQRFCLMPSADRIKCFQSIEDAHHVPDLCVAINGATQSQCHRKGIPSVLAPSFIRLQHTRRHCLQPFLEVWISVSSCHAGPEAPRCSSAAP